MFVSGEKSGISSRKNDSGSLKKTRTPPILVIGSGYMWKGRRTLACGEVRTGI